MAVLFGGSGVAGPTNDTWTWDSRRWLPVAVDDAPSPRQGGAFIYDPVRQVAVLFGGAGFGGWSDVLNDTWTFDGSHWARQSTATSPSPRAFSAVTFDSLRGVVVLYGGWTGTGAVTDVWTWDGTSWAQAPASNLPTLFPLGLTYRQADGSLLLVGQLANGSEIAGAVQTWSFVHQTWYQVTAAGSAPCLDHYGGSADSPRRGVIVFFGGYCSGATVEWDGSAWSAVTPSPSPPNRGNEGGRPAMVYDPDHQLVLLFGGVGNGTFFSDTWAWDEAGWTKVA